jgi:hypothetical protein
MRCYLFYSNIEVIWVYIRPKCERNYDVVLFCKMCHGAKYFYTAEALRFLRDAVKALDILGYYAAYVRSWLVTFQKILPVPYLRTKSVSKRR